jgi:cysteine desulfurase
MERIDLDSAATTPLAPEAREAMLRWLGPSANPSSLHWLGRAARGAVDEARETVASGFGCLFGEVVFTSSGTEAANLAIVGALLASPARRRVLVAASEHHCVVNCRPLIERLGGVFQELPVDSAGRLLPETLHTALGPDVLLVAAMSANNELGTLNDVAALSALTHAAGALVLTDAVQTFPDPTLAKISDLATASAHKLHGPTGVGALFVRAGTPVAPITLGGGQERDLRAGTENVAGIVGFAEATRLALADSGAARKAKARAAFLAEVSGAVLTVPADVPALPGHLHLRFPGVDAESLLIRLDRAGVAASAGAACSSGSIEPSHVLLAAGMSEAEAREGVRFSFSKLVTEDRAREAGRRTAGAVAEIRAAQTSRGPCRSRISPRAKSSRS